MTNKIVFDIETKNTFYDIESNDPADLDISLVGIYDSSDDTFHSYLEDELGELWKRIEKTDILIGYNSDHFDIPLLNSYYPGDLSSIKSIDLMKELKNVAGRRVKLDDVAHATLGKKKSGHGLQAITWWRQGELEKIRDYCLEDVDITKKIYEYVLENGSIKYTEKGRTRIIPIDTSNWENKSESAMTHTLPI
ncbi:MAG: ribonuclease H-like domain-containing protein [Candidatus Paceibacterota bacterium]